MNYEFKVIRIIRFFAIRILEEFVIRSPYFHFVSTFVWMKYSEHYSFHVFNTYDFHGLMIGDPITAASNLLLFMVGIWCYRRMKKISGGTISAEMNAGVQGWKLFFVVSAIAYLVGVPVHGFSYYIPPEIHFWMWIAMGWIQMTAVACVQLGTAKQYFPLQLKWIRPLVFVQLILCASIMVYIKKFGAVNADIAIGLIPIAIWNIYLYSKKRNASYLMGAGILFAIIPAVIVILKFMPAPWLTYNDIAHFLLIISLLVICRGVEKNVLMG
jgi:hypothetical protein